MCFSTMNIVKSMLKGESATTNTNFNTTMLHPCLMTKAYYMRHSNNDIVFFYSNNLLIFSSNKYNYLGIVIP